MKEVVGDIWTYKGNSSRLVITTNGTVKSNGECVMGRGIALQAKLKFPGLALLLGGLIEDYGNRVYRLDQYRLLSFPVKHNWYERGDLALIEESTKQLVAATGFASGLQGETIYMVRPGCGNGGLNWKDVKPILERHLDSDKFVVVNRE